MLKKFLRSLSVFLTLVMLVNMLPLNAWAADSMSESSLELSTGEPVTSGEVTEQTDVDLSNARIVEEVVAHRTEYSKEFKLNNGLYVSAVYSQAVHYETDNGWEEIDNTLKTNSDGTYSNTAGQWDVRFPQQLSGSKDITITKDGYTLSFRMAGELRQQPNVSLYAVDSASLTAETFQITENGTVQTFAVQSAQTAPGQIQAIDLTQAKEEAQYEEFVIGKNSSKLLYADVYANTDIRYDLKANQVKESIILESYSSTLRGYRYTLNTGGMIPVLQDDNSIFFYDAKQETVVMTMPAPFLVDANNEYNYDVQVSLTGSGSSWTLSYTLPTAWLAATERAWPVVLDPQVSAEIDVLNIRDQTVASNGSYSMYREVLECGYGPSYHIHHIYLKYRELPPLTSSDVVIDATIQLFKKDNTTNGDVDIEVHKVLGTWESESITWANKPGHDTTIEDLTTVEDGYRYYTWNVTDIVREWYAGTNTGLMFKASDATEAAGGSSWKHFYSSDCGTTSYMPSLTIVFRNNNGLEDYWDYTATSAGRAGTGYVNNYTGNLVWVRPDIGFDSNRMPVSISHVYNANDAIVHTTDDGNNSNNTAGNHFGLGIGWRTNYNQLVYQWDVDSDCYIWEDSDGTDHYFRLNTYSGEYVNEENLDLTLTVITTDPDNPEYEITDLYGNISRFDSDGRLVRQTNNQQTKSSVTITYEDDTKRISTITDGVGRVYRFTYSGELLSRLSCTNSAGTELTYLTCTYSGDQLTKITDKDGGSVTYGYGSVNKLLEYAQNVDGRKLTYTYNTIQKSYQPYRVSKISESDGSAYGGELNIEYANNQTVFRDYNGNVQIMQFNNFGNTISIQDGYGNAQTAEYANNNATDTTNGARANELRLYSQLQNTVGNVLPYSSFESGSNWTSNSSLLTLSRTTDEAYSANYSLKMVSSTEDTVAAIGSNVQIAPGETYIFSAYVKTEEAYAIIALQYGVDYTTYMGGHCSQNKDWSRLEIAYTNTTSETRRITPIIFLTTAGTAYVDCVQYEKAPTPSRFNLVENGDFRYGTDSWTNSGGYTAANLASAAGQLDNNAYSVTGSPTSQKRLTQTVNVSGGAGDIYTLTGWAKGDSAPLIGARQFGIYATINYTDNTSKMFVAQFNPDEDSANSWQYSAVELVASKAYDSITVAIAYDFNVNTAWFDGIQLYKEALGATYKYDNSGNITEYRDVLGQTTMYTYNSDDELIREVRPDGEELTYTYDSYHNLSKITSSNGTVQEYAYTLYGNCKEIKTTAGDISCAETYAYSTDGKEILQSKTTAFGDTVNYVYDTNTGLLTQATDSTGDRTNYTYDSMYRLISETVTSGESVLSVDYGYQNDLLTKIETASTSYTFSYGSFSQISSIKAGSHTLATYCYNDETTDDRKNDLDSIDYGNGHRVEYVYDDQGRVIEESYTKTQNNTTSSYGTIHYTYNSNGSLASVYDDYCFAYKHNYIYDSFGRLTQVRHGSATITTYTYNDLNQLTKVVDKAYGTTEYNYDQDRLSSEERSTGTKTYTYYDGGLLQKEVVNNNTLDIVKQSYTYNTEPTSPSSGMLTKYEIDAGPYSVDYSYTYDEKGNITAIDDGTYTTSYLYDGANQLVRENNQRANRTWTWTYDGSGNILYKREYAYTTSTLGTPLDTITYTYGDSSWGDLLTSYDGNTITYDEIGNPLDDGRRTYVWERGRRISFLDGWDTYYDSDGMRSERGYGAGMYYGYTYREGRLTRIDITIDYTDLIMIIDYDANGTPISLKCIAYYDTDTDNVTTYTDTYYYLVNPQGDVIGLTDGTGYLVATYHYDAWGKLVDTVYSSGISQLDRDVVDYNPLRYRGYIYDVETGLYYVSSRYYDPEIGRWINADGQISGVGGDIRGYNLFAYCFNNPVNMSDPTGNWPSWGQVFAAVATVAVAAVFVAAVVASAGAVGVAAGVAAASIGATGTMVSAAITVGTVGTYAVAAGIGACALSNAGEILTGTNVIRDGLMGGNQEAYDTVQTALNIAGGGAMILGQTNPGVTGNAAKPSPNAQTVHKVPTTGIPNTSFDKLYSGNTGGFQRTYYDFKGNVSLQIDFTYHNNPSIHSNPHLHIWGSSGRGNQINLWYLEGWI